MELFVVDTVDLLAAWVGHLFTVVRELDLRNQIAVLIFDRSELVDTAEGGRILRGNQVGPDTPGIDRCPLRHQGLDQKFIQIRTGGDRRVREAGLVQHGPGFL